jgi:hypothetical protein
MAFLHIQMAEAKNRLGSVARDTEGLNPSTNEAQMVDLSLKLV